MFLMCYLGNGSVKGTDNKSIGVHVEDQILAHDSQPDESNVSFRSEIYKNKGSVKLRPLI